MPNGMAKNSINYITVAGFPNESVHQDMINLYAEIFEDADISFFKQRIVEHQKLLSVLAYSNNVLTGFKVGYPYDEIIFYSWIGGVLPKFRRQGIAKHMALLQEQHAIQNGYKRLKKKSMNRFKAMMITNLKNGFNITKVYTNTKGQTKIVFEKELT